MCLVVMKATWGHTPAQTALADGVQADAAYWPAGHVSQL